MIHELITDNKTSFHGRILAWWLAPKTYTKILPWVLRSSTGTTVIRLRFLSFGKKWDEWILFENFQEFIDMRNPFLLYSSSIWQVFICSSFLFINLQHIILWILIYIRLNFNNISWKSLPGELSDAIACKIDWWSDSVCQWQRWAMCI